MILLDSSVLIDVLDSVGAVVDTVYTWRMEGEEVATSSLAVAEVMRGVGPGRRRGLSQQVLEAFPEIPFGPRAARRFGLLMHGLDRAGDSIGAIDGMIAAQALVEGAAVATHNRSEFDRVQGLDVLAVPS